MTKKILGRIPAEPGWRMLVAELGEDGKPVIAEEERYGARAYRMRAVEIASWCLTDAGGSMGNLFASMLMGLGGGASFQAADAEGNLIDGRILVEPGETPQEAADRAEEYERKQWEKKQAAAAAKGPA